MLQIYCVAYDWFWAPGSHIVQNTDLLWDAALIIWSKALKTSNLHPTRYPQSLPPFMPSPNQQNGRPTARQANQSSQSEAEIFLTRRKSFGVCLATVTRRTDRVSTQAKPQARQTPNASLVLLWALYIKLRQARMNNERDKTSTLSQRQEQQSCIMISVT